VRRTARPRPPRSAAESTDKNFDELPFSRHKKFLKLPHHFVPLSIRLCPRIDAFEDRVLCL
jgi:hypothetical protein